jgi:SOS-response transcriptional repressor LexA
MTKREQEVLAFVDAYQRAHSGVSPSMFEIASAIGLKAKSGAFRLLEALSNKGLVRRDAAWARSITITDAGRALLGLAPVDLTSVSDADLLTEMTRRGLLRMAA